MKLLENEKVSNSFILAELELPISQLLQAKFRKKLQLLRSLKNCPDLNLSQSLLESKSLELTKKMLTRKLKIFRVKFKNSK